MLDNLPILSLTIFSPLLGVLILLFISKDNGRLYASSVQLRLSCRSSWRSGC